MSRSLVSAASPTQPRLTCLMPPLAARVARIVACGLVLAVPHALDAQQTETGKKGTGKTEGRTEGKADAKNGDSKGGRGGGRKIGRAHV